MKWYFYQFITIKFKLYLNNNKRFIYLIYKSGWLMFEIVVVSSSRVWKSLAMF